MATELPRPGVEVIQEFASAAPTVVTPTLVPCNVAPFFEVIEVLGSDGTLNSDAQLASSYDQLEQTISQSSFPSPRGNIDEVDVQEDEIRTFFDFGGSLLELSRESAFLTSYLDANSVGTDVASRPYVDGATTEGSTTGGYDVDGRTLIVSVDGHKALPVTAGDLPTTNNVTITFAATTPGGRLSLDQVVAQINALIPNFASRSVAGGSGVLRLTSTNYGAGASVVVRWQGTANAGTDRLGFDAAKDEIAVGSGFYAFDDADGDLTTPRLKVYAGTSQKLLDAVDVPVITAPNFISDSIEVGDVLYANGVNIGEVALVESDQLTMETEQNLISHDNPFAPRRVWVQAFNLDYPRPGSSSQGSLTGSVQTAAASPAYIVPQSAFVGTSDPSESITVTVTIDGVAQSAETVTSGSGVPPDAWDTLANAKALIDTQATNFEAYYSNSVGDEVPVGIATHLGLRTLADNTGSGAGITLQSGTPSALTALGFTSAPVGDIGENIRFLPGGPARAWSATTAGSFPMAGTESVTLATTVKTTAGTFVAQTPEVITFAANADLAAAVTDWNSKSLWTEAYQTDSTGEEGVASPDRLGIKTKGESVGLSAEIDITVDATPIFGVQTKNGTDTDLDGQHFKWSLDHNPKENTVTFVADEDDGGTSLQQVLNKINELTPNVAAADSTSPPYLELTSQKYGEASEVEVIDGTANPNLGFTDNDTSTDQGGRPDPDLAINISGAAVLQSQILRDTLTGIPYNPGTAPIYMAYKGLRLDLSPEADDPSLLVIDDISTLEDAADPISTDNPGALMCYLSLLNAPQVSVAAIGVPEVSADAPDGTPLGYAKCAEFLESEEVYAIATASKLSTVHQTFMTHVNVMSEPEQKGERIYFFNPEIPDRDNPTLIGSGTDLNTTATLNECTIDVNIAPALIAEGIDPNADINPTSGPIENEVYLDIGTDDKRYLVQAVDNGTKLTLRTTFATGDGNSDSFFSTDDFPTTVISDDWTVFIRGEALLITGTTRPDRAAISETVQAAAQAYGFRRAYYVFPDQCAINITGLEQLVEGYYATACIVGMVGQLPPQQGFTNYPITGLTRVVGSNDQFTESQLNVMAAGGVYILVQDAQGAPVICRHQLSTNTTSIETRELSITKVVDYTAKFLRGGLRNFIGRSNITQGFLDNLSTVIQGQLNFLVEAGVLIGADINNLVQDADNPDTILVDVTLDVPYPANYIRLTLIV